MTKHTSFHLFALGPDCLTLGQCDSSELKAEYCHHISEELAQNAGISHDVFTGNHTIYLQHLRVRAPPPWPHPLGPPLGLILHQNLTSLAGEPGAGVQPKDSLLLQPLPSPLPLPPALLPSHTSLHEDIATATLTPGPSWSSDAAADCGARQH